MLYNKVVLIPTRNSVCLFFPSLHGIVKLGFCSVKIGDSFEKEINNFLLNCLKVLLNRHDQVS